MVSENVIGFDSRTAAFVHPDFLSRMYSQTLSSVAVGVVSIERRVHERVSTCTLLTKEEEDGMAQMGGTSL